MSSSLFSGNGCWSRRSRRQKIAIIATGIVVVVVVIVVCCTTIKTNNSNPVAEICETEICKEESQRLLNNINASVDPCEDFYEFACGNFATFHELPPDKSRLATFDLVSDEVLARLKTIYAQGDTTDNNSTYKSPKPVQFVSQFYRTCKNASSDLKSLKTLLRDLGGWPIANISAAPGGQKTWLESLVSVITNYGEGFIVSVAVNPNPLNTSEYILAWDQPSFGVGRTELIKFKENDTESERVVNAYKTYLMKTVTLLFEGRKETEIDHKKLQEDVNKVIDLESRLANASTAPEDRRDHRKTTISMSLQNLTDETGLTWSHTLIRDVYSSIQSSNIVVTSDEMIIVSDLPYYKELWNILKDTPPQVIRNYLGWRILQSIGFLSGEEFRKNEFEFKQVQTGIEKPLDMERRCLDFVMETVPEIVGRSYVDLYFSEEERDSAQEMIDAILLVFKDIIREKDWMDQETRKNSLEKAEKLLVNTAYPDWLLEDEELEEKFPLEPSTTEVKTIESVRKLYTTLVKKDLEMLRKLVERSKEWPMGPAVVNAAYDPTQNSITIPAAILQGVFFNMSRPSYLNFGAMGAVIGHEITHGFDDEGAQFDFQGNLHNWWTNETEQHFRDKSQCFVDEYSSIFDKRVNLTLNGLNTLGENIADNGGIREAFQAYLSTDRLTRLTEPLLPGLKYNHEQLFFLSYANTWCSVTRAEKLRQSILYDPHSPPKFRVNIPLSNYPEFSRVWKCSAASKMTKKEVCLLW